MIRLTIRVILIIAAGVFFLWLFDQNLPVAGVKIITYTFNEVGGPVSEPYPRDRVQNETATASTGSSIRMVEEPLYFDVRSRVDYESADITLYLRNNSSRQVQLGARVFGDTWQTVIPSDQRRATAAEGWDTINAQFDLRTVPRHQNKYTFVISAPGLRYEADSKESIYLSHADIHLLRKPLFKK